jgi:hypothetical protein
MLIKSLIMLLELVFSIFLEKTTKKTSRNSGKPLSQPSKDNTSADQKGSKGKGKQESSLSTDNSRTVVTDLVLSVESCSCCGESLKSVKSECHERRTRIDIIFEKVVEHFEAEIKNCPSCQAVNKGDFASGVRGKLQYGNGLKAFIFHLIVSQMVAINRVQKI